LCYRENPGRFLRLLCANELIAADRMEEFSSGGWCLALAFAIGVVVISRALHR
jgi:hypothetical protein